MGCAKLRIFGRCDDDGGGRRAMRAQVARQKAIGRHEKPPYDENHAHDHRTGHRHAGQMIVHLSSHREHRQVRAYPRRDRQTSQHKSPDRLPVRERAPHGTHPISPFAPVGLAARMDAWNSTRRNSKSRSSRLTSKVSPRSVSARSMSAGCGMPNSDVASS